MTSQNISSKEWPKALKSEKRYMRQSLYIGDMKPENFFERVKKMNEYLLFFPFVKDDDDDPTKFKEDELISIVTDRNAKKFQWHIDLMTRGQGPDSFDTLEAVQECYINLYHAEELQKRFLPPDTIGAVATTTNRK